MKGSSSINRIPPHLKFLLGLLGVAACAAAAGAQTSAPAPAPTTVEAAPSASPSPAPTETEAAQKRIARARALAAIGKLAAAAAELESLRSSTADESVRDVSRVLLMAIFVEMPDYTRAAALLDEAFRARSNGGPDGAAAQAYFALAGQTVSAVRTHLERYRLFGLNVSDTDLPAEANGDLSQLRTLLERVVEQAKAIGGEQAAGARDAGRRSDATALLEDAATARMRVAYPGQDRTRWQAEVSEARQRLFASETRIASVSDIPAARQRPAPAQSAAPGQTSTQTPSQPANVRASSSSPTSAPATGAGNAAAAPVAATPVAIGSLLTKARKRQSPSYPTAARMSRISGVVTVFLLVNESGDVEAVERSDGPTTLQAAAVDAARRWKFNPTVVNGQPVRVRGYLSFDFKP